MALADIVNVTITKATAQVSRAGFGTPLIAAYHTHWPERVRVYNASSMLTSLADQGFATDSPAYLAAQAILSQNPRPPRIKIGRRDNSWTQTVELTPNDTTEGLKYTITIGDETAEYTVQAADTVADITLGLTTAINALTVAVTATDNSTEVSVAADNVAEIFDFYQQNPELDVVDVTADAGIAADLGTIRSADADWYGLVVDSNSDAENEAAAAWAETQRVVFSSASFSTDTKGSGSGDSFSTMDGSDYARTAGLYHPQAAEYAGAAWLGKMLPKDPGSASWAYKTLAGTPVTDITPTEQTNLEGKSANYYIEVAGVSVTLDGRTFSGEFVDITRFIDWLQARIQERIFALLASSDKLPYTDVTVDLIRSEILAQLEEGIDAGGIAESPEPTVTASAVADVSSNDRAARRLPDVEFTARLAGAVHTIDISGTVTV